MDYDFTVPVPELKGKISRQKTKSGTYIHYILERTYDEKKRHTVPKRVLIGKLSNEDGRMFPNKSFFTYFPNTPRPESPASTSRCSVLSMGAYAVISKIVNEYGLKEMLEKYFGNKAGLALDLASYMIVEEQNQGQHFPDYAYHHALFSNGMKIASDSTISRFLSSITDDQITGFLNEWSERQDHKSKIYISYDSTNKNSQAGDVDFLEFGNAKVDIGAPIFNVALAYDRNNQVPLFYELYPGSINDVSQFRYFVDKTEAYGFKGVGFIIDRGYFSKANIDYMDEHKYEFVMMVKGCKSLVADLVDATRGKFENSLDHRIAGRRISGITVSRPLYENDQKNRFFHLFFNPFKMASEQAKFEDQLEEMKSAFDRAVGMKVKFGRPFTDYFVCHYDKAERFLFAKIKKEVVEKRMSRLGYFCIITSENMTARDAYLLYTSRDASEKLFSSDKSFLGSNSMRVHSAESISAKIFIEFVGLIIRQRMYVLLKEQMLKLPVRKNYLTIPAAIRELSKIELIRVNHKKYQLDHAVTKNQEIILRSFGLTKESVAEEASNIANIIEASEQAKGNLEEYGDDNNGEAQDYGVY